MHLMGGKNNTSKFDFTDEWLKKSILVQKKGSGWDVKQIFLLGLMEIILFVPYCIANFDQVLVDRTTYNEHIKFCHTHMHAQIYTKLAV